MDKMKESIRSGSRDHHVVDDEHSMVDMKEWPREGSGKSGGSQGGRYQEDARAVSNESGFTNAGAVRDMSIKDVGSMADDKYGKDLSQDATNSLGRFDADSDTMDTRRLLPRNASGIL